MKKSKAQSVLEYTLIVVTVAAAFVAMNIYLKRAVGARLAEFDSYVNPPQPVTQ